MALTFLSPLVMPQQAYATSGEDLVEEINGYISGTSSIGTLSASFDDTNNTVTVVGEVTEANACLELAIDPGVTVIWLADYCGDFSGNAGILVKGGGTFILNNGTIADTGVNGACLVVEGPDTVVEVASGCIAAGQFGSCGIRAEGGSCVKVSGNGAINNSGMSSAAIEAEASTVIINGGSITSMGENARGVFCDESSTLTIYDGSIDASGAESTAVMAQCPLTIEGGTLLSSGQHGTALDAEAQVIIREGTISVSGPEGRGITTSAPLNIFGGTLEATGLNNIGIDTTAALVVAGGDISTTMNGGIGINSTSDVSILEGSISVDGEQSVGIRCVGSSSTTTVSGGVVSAHGTQGFGIMASGGSRVTADGGQIVVDGPECSAILALEGTEVTIQDGATVSSNSSGGATIVVHDSNATVLGGEVSSHGDDSSTLYATGEGQSSITVAGGRVLNMAQGTEYYTIYAEEDGCVVSIEGGLVFGIGSSVSGTSESAGIISVTQEDNLTIADPGVAIAWDKQNEHSVYVSRTDEDITCETNSTSACWECDPNDEGAIYYENGENKGFITLADIRVEDPALVGTLTIEGDDQIGSTLELKLDDVEGTYDIIWLRNGQIIEGANEAHYTLTEEDSDATISAKLVGKDGFAGEVVSDNSIQVKKDSGLIPGNQDDPQAEKPQGADQNDYTKRVSGSAYGLGLGKGMMPKTHDDAPLLPASLLLLSLLALSSGALLFRRRNLQQ